MVPKFQDHQMFGPDMIEINFRVHVKREISGRMSTRKQNKERLWGRAYGTDVGATVGAALVFFLSPLLPLYFYIACTKYECALSSPALEILHGRSIFEFYWSESPRPTWEAVKIFVVWELFQLVLYLFVPGPVGMGQETPAGHKLKYNVNGLRAWAVTHIVFLGCVIFGIFPGTIVYDNWGPLLIVANVFGYSLAIFVYIKAIVAPTHARDVKFSGNFIYDFFLGTEFNPRIGNFDFKLFFNGRPGIIGWNVINLSFCFAQWQKHGSVTNSMILVIVLHLIYILDFFWNEDWYLRTIDIAHDHFGWYLAWGDTVWLPWMYTLQGFYLVYHPTKLSTIEFVGVLALGLAGYYIFRAVNNQKNDFRQDPHNYKIWGKKATFIEAPYKTADGATKKSYLLTSGFWGWARHFNYLGDLAISYAFCAACGYKHLYPFFYIIYMMALLLHRVERDHGRCQDKYGPVWTKYTKQVPYKVIPYLY